MELSFIIPALNEEKVIANCINSIKSQIAPYLEIIVIDNNSTDKTPIISKDLGCKVYKEEKRGISYARNRGAKYAKGDVLCFVDADCVLSKYWVHEATQTLTNSKVLAVSGINIFEHKKLLKKYYYNIYTVLVYGFVLFSTNILQKPYISGNNLAIRKGVFFRLGGFEPVVGEDFWFSKKFWSLYGNKTKINLKMKVYLSSRGFEAAGFIRTLILWSKSTLKRTSQEGYTYKNKNLTLRRKIVVKSGRM